MEWQHPESLYLILPLCAAWLGLSLFSNRRRQRARDEFAAPAMWSRIAPAESRSRFWTKLILREIAIIAGLVALAGPKFGVQYEQVIPRGSDLYVLIDVSRSMLADDVPPSRLGRAKADVSALLNRLQGERVGLIAFAGQAVVKCPLTIDYDSFRRALEELDPDSAPRGGTAIGDAIRKGLEVFHAKSERDQAMLIITDGDDQQSYPLEAAAIAAERHVTIFTVGLGDADRGARIPQKSDAKSYLEYKGEQVWSKLDHSLLEQIALKTNGVYIPAGTRHYDLGELYSQHLQGRRGDDSANTQRIRRSERFQIFLAIAWLALMIDLVILPYRRSSFAPSMEGEALRSSVPAGSSRQSRRARETIVGTIAILILHGIGQMSVAVEPRVEVRDGLKLYSKEQYDAARDKFAAAEEELQKQKAASAAIAAFDEACALHKRGEIEKARECYLRAGLSQDLKIATAAHFNLGNLAAEQARHLSGEHPELVPPDKRQEILDHLAQSIAAYRHCLELQSDHGPSRRNLELARQWIKYFTDQWRERDRQKRRDESNLVQFLEFLIQSETALRETVTNLPLNVHSDVLAELKRHQQELRDEIPTLREKIGDELRPQQDPSGKNNANSPEREEAIALLRDWADVAGREMSTASTSLVSKELTKAATSQQSAVDELEKIWEAVIPFHPLLNRLLADQTSIAKALTPQSEDEKKDDTESNGPDNSKIEESPEAANPSPSTPPARLQVAEDDLERLQAIETKTLKRTRQLAPKAEMELQHQEAAAMDKAQEGDKTIAPGQPEGQSSVDPEQMKEGYRKAIEMAPQAVEQMEAAVNAMRQKHRVTAGQHAEEASNILELIQQAQPKNEQQKDQQQQDQQNQDQQKNGQQQQDQKNNEQQKDGDQKKDEKKEQAGKQDTSSKEESPDPKQPQAPMSKDRVESALRKVRERQQEKRERDRKLKGLYLGRTPVDKDW